MIKIFLLIGVLCSFYSCTERKFTVLVDNQTGKNISLTGKWNGSSILEKTKIEIFGKSKFELIDNKSDKDIELTIEHNDIKGQVGCYYQRGSDQIVFKLTLINNKFNVDCSE